MKKKLNYLFFALVFLCVVFSCKSAAPSVENESTKPESAESGETAPAEEVLPQTEADAAGTDLPPETPDETEIELTEPETPDLRPSVPAVRMTTTPPPPMVQRGQPRREEQLPEPELLLPPEAESPPQINPPLSPPPVQPQTPPPAATEPSLPALPPELPSETPAIEETTPPPPERESPPEPPAFVRPSEPAIPPPERENVPMPQNPPPELPSRIPPENESGEIIFSRTVRALVGQIVEVPFNGTGWVYLGELGNRRGIVYDSRRLDSGSVTGSDEGQSFIFRAEATGTYVLKFYRRDHIRDYIINDYVQVIVEDEYNEHESTAPGRIPVDRGRVIAEPRWPSRSETPVSETPVPASEKDTPPVSESVPVPGIENAAETPAQAPEIPSNPSEDTGTTPRETVTDESIEPVTPPQALAPVLAPIPLDAMPDEYVLRARQEFDAGRVENALIIMDLMKQRFPSGTDEAWWLYGQLLEANSPARNIRLALEYYRRLVAEYPQSPRVGDALRRIAYLERFYFNIR